MNSSGIPHTTRWNIIKAAQLMSIPFLQRKSNLSFTYYGFIFPATNCYTYWPLLH